MSDTELIEAAAKAAGMTGVVWEASAENDEPCAYLQLGKGKYWRPLSDDGDALRLAVKLEATVYVIGSGMAEVKGDGRKRAFWHDAGGDTELATRRAIVLYAAGVTPASEE